MKTAFLMVGQEDGRYTRQYFSHYYRVSVGITVSIFATREEGVPPAYYYCAYSIKLSFENV
jgi:hypothetical protein